MFCRNVKQYNLKSKNELLKKWKLLVNDNNHLVHIDNPIAKKETLQQYDIILPMIKEMCPSALQEAEVMIKSLNKQK